MRIIRYKTTMSIAEFSMQHCLSEETSIWKELEHCRGVVFRSKNGERATRSVRNSDHSIRRVESATTRMTGAGPTSQPTPMAPFIYATQCFCKHNSVMEGTFFECKDVKQIMSLEHCDITCINAVQLKYLYIWEIVGLGFPEAGTEEMSIAGENKGKAGSKETGSKEKVLRTISDQLWTTSANFSRILLGIG